MFRLQYVTWTLSVIVLDDGDVRAAVKLFLRSQPRSMFAGLRVGVPHVTCIRKSIKYTLSRGVSKHWQLDCLLNRLSGLRPKKTSKPALLALCEGNPPVTGGFPPQKASNTESVSMVWRHHEWSNLISQGGWSFVNWIVTGKWRKGCVSVRFSWHL